MSEADQAAAELAAYLLEDVIDGEENPLAWWKNNESRFPLMSLVTLKFLCVGYLQQAVLQKGFLAQQVKLSPHSVML